MGMKKFPVKTEHIIKWNSLRWNTETLFLQQLLGESGMIIDDVGDVLFFYFLNFL